MTDTIHSQAGAVQALAAILSAFPTLPTAGLEAMELAHPDVQGLGLRISTYDTPVHFEQWREALAVNPDRLVLVSLNSSGHVLRGHGCFAGIPVQLLGFFPLLNPAA
ncbi:hypothetical protein [Streptacidiphilus carbonis]|uniref:hypothetical protein n=1 Tax=Streptacidiphilus carbonis TaxID=105422 RepID=UPI0005AA81C7|nr:hypothetical protein [Streptacidiphilus carbonis]